MRLTRIAIALTACAVLNLASSASAAPRMTVFIFVAPDPALGGLVSDGLLDSAEDLKTLIGRRLLGLGGLKVTNKRANARLLVQVISRGLVDEEYRVRVQITLPDGSTRDLVGSDTRQWKRCMLPIAAALSDLGKAGQTLIGRDGRRLLREEPRQGVLSLDR
jgi:hypothetical protein